MDVTEGDILKVFGKFGTISSCAWLYHYGGPHRGKPKGFCFVEMKTRAESQKAADALNGRRLRGRELRINFAKDEAEPSTDLTETPAASADANRLDRGLAPPTNSEATLERRAAMVKQTLLGMGVALPPRLPPGPPPQPQAGNLDPEKGAEATIHASSDVVVGGGDEKSGGGDDDGDEEDVVSSILNGD